MRLLGITGGIGMGKSAAASLLAARSVPVVDTDDLARQLVIPGSAALSEIRTAFGPDTIGPEGTLERRWLAQRIFSDPAARERLEQILHPRIAAAWRAEVEQWRRDGTATAAVVIPLLFEKGYGSDFDAVVCVACSSGIQRHRLRERGWSEEQIDARNSAQLAVSEKVSRSRFVVWTEGSFEAHAGQWRRVLDRI
jgi:dephospho-CoA kinase